MSEVTEDQIDAAVQATIEEWKQNGTWDDIARQMAENPGSELRHRMTSKGDIEFYVANPHGMPVWAFGLHLVVAIALSIPLAWLLSIASRWLLGPIQDGIILFQVECALVAVMSCFTSWRDRKWWRDLSPARRLIVGVLSAIVVIAILATGILRISFYGALIVIVTFVIALAKLFKGPSRTSKKR